MSKFKLDNSDRCIDVIISGVDRDAVPLKIGGEYIAHIINIKDYDFLKQAFIGSQKKGRLIRDNLLFNIEICSLGDKNSDYTFSFNVSDCQAFPFNPIRLHIQSEIHPNDNDRHWYCSLFRNNMTLTEFFEIPVSQQEGDGIIVDSSLDFLEFDREKTDYGILLEYCDSGVTILYFIAFCSDSEKSYMKCYIPSFEEIKYKHNEICQEKCKQMYLNNLHMNHNHYEIIYDRNVLYYDISKKNHDKNGNVIENIRDRTIEITIEQWEIQTYMRAMSKSEYESLGSPEVNSTFKFTESSTVEKFVTYEFEREYIWTAVKSALALPNPPTIFLEFTSSKSPTKISEVKPDYGELGGGIESILNFTSEDICTVKRIIDLNADFSIFLFDVNDNKQYVASIIPNNHKEENFGGNYDNHFICSADIEGKVKYYYLVKTESDIYKVLTVNDDFLKIFLTDKYYPEYLKKNQEALLKVRIKEGN